MRICGWRTRRHEAIRQPAARSCGAVVPGPARGVSVFCADAGLREKTHNARILGMVRFRDEPGPVCAGRPCTRLRRFLSAAYPVTALRRHPADLPVLRARVAALRVLSAWRAGVPGVGIAESE